MSYIRINSIKIKNYRSFGEEQTFCFPDENCKKPVAIVGYNNSGKTNLMNAILYGIGEKYISDNAFKKDDLYNLDIDNQIEIKTIIEASNYFNNGWENSIAGDHLVSTTIEDGELKSSIKPSFFGASKHYNIFYINFHEIKDQISTKRTNWGNLSSFLAKHIKKIVDSDEDIKEYKSIIFKSLTKTATNLVLDGSNLENFITNIKNNFSTNLRNNNCEVEFGLPDYEDIFLQMMFKIGLNGDKENLIPIDHFGDGYISMFVMAVIQAIAESNTEDKCLFLFEEPESFLHENHQEYFYKMVLCGLAKKGHQVIYTTHSAKMVDIFDPEGLKALVRIDFDEIKKQTEKKYNKANEEFSADISESPMSLDQFNNFIKNIEPNLGKILFSKKVVLVEGPNDLMVYKYIIEKKIKEKIKNNSEISDKDKFAETFLNFNNIAIIPHYGKATVLFPIKVCKYLGLDCFVINDWDFETDFRDKINLEFDNLKKDSVWGEIKKEKNKKGEELEDSKIMAKITVNKNIISESKPEQCHFNIPKLEKVLGYNFDDKDSVKIWKKLEEIKTEDFGENIFPKNLEDFLEFEKVDKIGEKKSKDAPLVEENLNTPSNENFEELNINIKNIPF